MEKERLQHIDIAKGLCILLVVVGHILQYNFSGTGSSSAFNFIYSFHMPLFMLLSGYVAALSTKKIDFQIGFGFVKRKFYSLAIPFFVWGLFITPFIIRQENLADFFSIAKRLVTDPNSGAWFIIVLFFIQLYFLVFRIVTQKISMQKVFVGECISFAVVLGLLCLTSTVVGRCEDFLSGG